ncbi:MAG: cbb3-type cytochrome c oxidase subunit 3 [Chromatiales bacterium]|nr:cbb3-type cytochrome c oxidase subunit 3 [Chromatiales bacterium]
MDLVTVRSLFTVLIFAVFIGIVIWAWSKRQKNRFDEAAQLPFEDEELSERSAKAADKE